MTNPKISLLIEGNICEGKTWAAEEISRQFKFVKVLEPVKEESRKFFYSDPGAHGFIFDVEMAAARARMCIQAMERAQRHTDICGIVMDRWVLSGSVFRRAAGVEDETFEGVLERLLENCPEPTHMIYLKGDPEILHQRVNTRSLVESALDEREGVTLDYLQKLDATYSHYIEWMRLKFPKMKVLVYDTTQSFLPMEEVKKFLN